MWGRRPSGRRESRYGPCTAWPEKGWATPPAPTRSWPTWSATTRCSSSRPGAHDYLAQHFPEVREILGFSLAYEDNAIRRWETVVQNLRGAVSRWPAQIRSFYEVARDFDADVGTEE